MTRIGTDVLTVDLPAEGLTAGDIGTVVHVHKGGEGYEFMTLDGQTVAICLRIRSAPSLAAKSPTSGPLRRHENGASIGGVSTLTEIEAATEKLLPEEKQELLFFLATRLRAERGTMPEPRKFSKEEMDAWIAEDEADMRRLREGA